MSIIEVIDVAIEPPDYERVWGFNLDSPRAGDAQDGHAVQVTGWALCRTSRAVAVEFLDAAGVVIRRAALHRPRPDLAAAFPDCAEAASAGFVADVPLAARADVDLRVRAVLADGGRLPIGSLRTRRRWQDHAIAPGEPPLVSVVIPCYRQAHFLADAIDSVVAQTYPHVEIVVIDDGSPDNTARVVARYPGVRLVRQPNAGLAEARNAGIRQSDGAYLVFLDADDRLLPDAVRCGVDALAAHPESAMAWGHYHLIGWNGARLPDVPQELDDDFRRLLRGNHIAAPGCAIYRRAVFTDVGVFDPSVAAAADFDLYLRIAARAPLAGHGKYVIEYRRHVANMSQSSAVMLSATMTVQRRYRREARRRGKEYFEAYREGCRFWRDMFGTTLIEQITSLWSDRRRVEAARAALTLLRHHPRAFGRLLIPQRTGASKSTAPAAPNTASAGRSA